MRTPSGERIDLTGTWGTPDAGMYRGDVYFLHQVGSCLWFAGGFPHPDAVEAIEEYGPLGYLTVLFYGRIQSDFTIEGTWTDVRHHSPALQATGGTLTLRVVFGDDGEAQIVYVDSIGDEFVEPNQPDTDMTWVKVSDGGSYPPPLEAP